MAIYVQRFECLKSSNILLFFIACCHIGGGTGRFVFLAHKTNKLSFACALIFLSCQQPVYGCSSWSSGVSNLRGNQNLGFQEQSHECSTTSSSLFSPSEMPLWKLRLPCFKYYVVLGQNLKEFYSPLATQTLKLLLYHGKQRILQISYWAMMFLLRNPCPINCSNLLQARLHLNEHGRKKL